MHRDAETLQGIQQARAGMYERFVGALRNGPAPPAPLALQRFGSALAIRKGGERRVIGLLAGELGQLDAILDWYGDETPFFDVLPLESNAPLTEALARRGYYQRRCQSFLCARPTRRDLEPPSSVTVEETTQTTQAQFARVLHGDPAGDDEDSGRRLRWIADQYSGSDSRCFLARVDGEPAAAGAMVLVDDIAYLPSAATHHRFRRRGCHSLLLRHRIDRAAREGAALVAADTQVGIASQRNLQREGLELACHVVQWHALD